MRAVRVREEYRGAGLAVDESRVAHVARRVGPRGNVGEARAAGNFMEAQVVPGQRDARGRAARSRADEAPVVHARYLCKVAIVAEARRPVTPRAALLKIRCMSDSWKPIRSKVPDCNFGQS